MSIIESTDSAALLCIRMAEDLLNQEQNSEGTYVNNQLRSHLTS